MARPPYALFGWWTDIKLLFFPRPININVRISIALIVLLLLVDVVIINSSLINGRGIWFVRWLSSPFFPCVRTIIALSGIIVLCSIIRRGAVMPFDIGSIAFIIPINPNIFCKTRSSQKKNNDKT